MYGLLEGTDISRNILSFRYFYCSSLYH